VDLARSDAQKRPRNESSYSKHGDNGRCWC
jgi:hypothetical protein